jgi:copper chaperone
MCEQTFSITGITSKRDEYEVEEFLQGVTFIQSASVDFLDKTVTIEYDENTVNEDDVLDAIEHAGCTPEPRASGLIHRIRSGFAG